MPLRNLAFCRDLLIQGGKQGSRTLVGTEGISVSSKPGTKKVCQLALGADARNNTREETAQKWTQELNKAQPGALGS